MNLTYPEIFAARGGMYHAAMLDWPQARDAEFEGLFGRQPLVPGERLLDFPSGGFYLARYLGERARVDGFELTGGFAPGIPVGLPPVPAPGQAYDRAVCLAALHHIDDQPGFLRALAARVKPGGWLHVADVAVGSPLTQFLDGFVGRYNETGHNGMYLPADPAFFAGLGEVRHCAEVVVPWRFADEAAMLGFCALLFGLRDCPPEELRAQLHDKVGVVATGAGVELQWRLLYVDIHLPGAG